MSKFDINKERSKYLMPQSDLKLSNPANESHFSILLVQNTNINALKEIKNGSFGNGWDLIMPT